MRNDAKRAAELARRRSRRTSAALKPGLDDDGGEREGREDLISREKKRRPRGARIRQAREHRAARGEDTIEERRMLVRVRAVEPSTHDDDSAPRSLEGRLVRGRVDAKRASGPDRKTSRDKVVDEPTREGASLGARVTAADDGDARQARQNASQVQGWRRPFRRGEGAEDGGVARSIGREDDGGMHVCPSTEPGESCAKTSARGVAPEPTPGFTPQVPDHAPPGPGGF